MSSIHALTITLSGAQREVLERLHRRQKCPQRLARRVGFILGADDGESNAAIARTTGTSLDAVCRWRKRFHHTADRLATVEASADADDRDLLDAIVESLSDRPRSGRPPEFTAAEFAAIISIARERSEDSDRPVSHWTPREVADEAFKRGVLKTRRISPRHVRRLFSPTRSQAASRQAVADPAGNRSGGAGATR